jgi:hypothetical protein
LGEPGGAERWRRGGKNRGTPYEVCRHPVAGVWSAAGGMAGSRQYNAEGAFLLLPGGPVFGSGFADICPEGVQIAHEGYDVMLPPIVFESAWTLFK